MSALLPDKMSARFDSKRDAGCSCVSHLHPESSQTRPFRGGLAVAGPRFKGGGEIQHYARFVFHFLLLGSGGGLCRTVWHLRHVRSAFPAVGQPRSLRGCHPVGGSGIILPLILISINKEDLVTTAVCQL